MKCNGRNPAAGAGGRITGAVFYLAAAVLLSAWYLVAAIAAQGREAPERARRALESAGVLLPSLGLLCMLMGVLELLQASLNARKGG